MNLHNFEQNSMGTRVTITIYSTKSREVAHKNAQKAFAIFEKLEQQFSTFIKDSELNQINKNAGKLSQATPLMLETVAYALKLAKETNGVFNPLVGTLTSQDGLTQKIDPNAYQKIAIDFKNQTITIPAQTALDLNSIVKGMAIDMALESISEEENVMIEAGGDLKMKGLPPGENFWKIGIRNPNEPTKIITVLKLKSGAICTSGKYFRKEKATKENRYHLVNPHGNHSENIATSMTVIAPTAKEADALSTAAFFMPIEQAVQLVENHFGTSCLMIDQNNQVFASNQMKSHFALT